MKIQLCAGALFFVLLSLPLAADAQQRSPGAFETPADTTAKPQVQQEEVRPEEAMSTSGFFLGVIGMLAGGAIGSQVGQSDCPDRTEDKECMSRHAYTGALMAGTVMVPLGVHLANAQRRNLPVSLAVSALTGGLLYYGLKAIPGEPIAIAPFLAAPLQVVTSIKMEKRN